MKKFGNLGSLLMVLSMMMGSGAYATPMLRLFDGSTTVSITDGGGFDLAAAAGVVQFSGVFDVWLTNVSTGFTKPNVRNATDPQMRLNSVNVTSGAGTLTIEFSETGFGPAAVGTRFLDQICGTTDDGRVIAAQYYGQNNDDFPTLAIASLDAFGPGAFSGSTFSSRHQLRTAIHTRST